MKRRFLYRFLTLSAVYFAAGNPAFAQTMTAAGNGSTPTAMASSGATTAAASAGAAGAPRIPPRLVDEYAALAGSPGDAEQLLLGLRQSTPVTLGSGAAQATITPPTPRLGWGNVRHALSIARAELAAAGIDKPTPEQLKVALIGGTLPPASGTGAATPTTMPGVLTLRSQGMGWGRIERRLGGEAMRHGGRSVTASGNRQPAARHAVPENRESLGEDHRQAPRGEPRRIVTATGAAASATAPRGERRDDVGGELGRPSSRARIVTAAGDPAAGASTTSGTRRDAAEGARIVTAASGHAVAGRDGHGGRGRN